MVEGDPGHQNAILILQSSCPGLVAIQSKSLLLNKINMRAVQQFP
jgi:hypothetical protein